MQASSVSMPWLVTVTFRCHTSWLWCVGRPGGRAPCLPGRQRIHSGSPSAPGKPGGLCRLIGLHLSLPSGCRAGNCIRYRAHCHTSASPSGTLLGHTGTYLLLVSCMWHALDRWTNWPHTSGSTWQRMLPWRNARPSFRKQPRHGRQAVRHPKPAAKPLRTKLGRTSCTQPHATCTTRGRCCSCSCGSSPSAPVSCKVRTAACSGYPLPRDVQAGCQCFQ